MCLSAIICDSPLKSNSHNATSNNGNCVSLTLFKLIRKICTISQITTLFTKDKFFREIVDFRK